MNAHGVSLAAHRVTVAESHRQSLKAQLDPEVSPWQSNQAYNRPEDFDPSSHQGRRIISKSQVSAEGHLDGHDTNDLRPFTYIGLLLATRRSPPSFDLFFLETLPGALGPSAGRLSSRLAKQTQQFDIEDKEDSKLSMSSDETPELMSFKLLPSPVKDGLAARLGRFTMPQRATVTTPNYFAIASRGSIPHMTPDVLKRYTSLGGAYMALEDCEFPCLCDSLCGCHPSDCNPGGCNSLFDTDCASHREITQAPGASHL